MCVRYVVLYVVVRCEPFNQPEIFLMDGSEIFLMMDGDGWMEFWEFGVVVCVGRTTFIEHVCTSK